MEAEAEAEAGAEAEAEAEAEADVVGDDVDDGDVVTVEGVDVSDLVAEEAPGVRLQS